MKSISALPSLTFSHNNTYASKYHDLYQKSVDAENRLETLKRSVDPSEVKIEKAEQDLKTCLKKLDEYTLLAKNEEKRLENNNYYSDNGLGQKLNCMA